MLWATICGGGGGGGGGGGAGGSEFLFSTPWPLVAWYICCCMCGGIIPDGNGRVGGGGIPWLKYPGAGGNTCCGGWGGMFWPSKD